MAKHRKLNLAQAPPSLPSRACCFRIRCTRGACAPFYVAVHTAIHATFMLCLAGRRACAAQRSTEGGGPATETLYTQEEDERRLLRPPPRPVAPSRRPRPTASFVSYAQEQTKSRTAATHCRAPLFSRRRRLFVSFMFCSKNTRFAAAGLPNFTYGPDTSTPPKDAPNARSGDATGGEQSTPADSSAAGSQRSVMPASAALPAERPPCSTGDTAGALIVNAVHAGARAGQRTTRQAA